MNDHVNEFFTTIMDAIMPSPKYAGNWFYMIEPKDIMGTNPEFFPNEGANTLQAMIQADNASLKHIRRLLWDYLEIVNSADTMHPLGFLDRDLATLKESLQVCKDDITNLTTQRNKLNAAIEEYNDTVHTIQTLAMHLLQAAGVKSHSIADGTEFTIKNNPGKLIADTEPTASDFARYGENVVKAKYVWNLTGIKQGVMDGAIEHSWMDKHGFHYEKSQSLRIKE